jgi:hypothetical protein
MFRSRANNRGDGNTDDDYQHGDGYLANYTEAEQPLVKERMASLEQQVYELMYPERQSGVFSPPNRPIDNELVEAFNAKITELEQMTGHIAPRRKRLEELRKERDSLMTNGIDAQSFRERLTRVSDQLMELDQRADNLQGVIRLWSQDGRLRREKEANMDQTAGDAQRRLNDPDPQERQLALVRLESVEKERAHIDESLKVWKSEVKALRG